MQIDYSQRACFQSCPMKYYLIYMKGLVKRKYDEREIDREFGKCVHSYLELHSLKKDVDKVWSNFVDLPNELCKTMKNGVSLCKNYVEHYKLLDASDEVLGVEIKDTFDIDGTQYTVKIDKIVKKNDNIYVVDYKTTKSARYNYFSQFNPNSQVSGYVLYALKKYGQCSGMIIDAIMVGHRKRPYKGEPAGFHVKFEREPVNRTSEQLDDFVVSLKSDVKKIKRCIDNNDWSKHEINCGQFRGCEFRELCLTSVGTKLDEEIAETLYEVKDTRRYLK